MKNFRLQLVLLLGSLCLSGSLYAQAPVTHSPWTVGVELSTSLTKLVDPYAEQAELFTHQVAAAKLSYRPVRWLEAWARFQYHAVAAQLPTLSAFNTISILDMSTISGGLATRSYDMDINALLVGAEAMLRVGQGDLGISFGLGPSRRTGRIEAINQEGTRFTARLEPLNEWRQYTQLAYTYWSTRQFGLRLGVSYSQLVNRYADTFSVRLTDKVNDGVGSYRNLDLTERLAPAANDFTFTWQLGLGVVYRW